jgi:hypothetical protein
MCLANPVGVGTEESATYPLLFLTMLLTPACMRFQLAQMRSEIEAVLMRHLKRGKRIYLSARMSIGILVTNLSTLSR